MKKTLVALSVLAAAGAVNAAEVYNNDGVSVSVSGSAEVQFIQDYENDATTTTGANQGVAAVKNDARLRLDDGDLTVTTAINLQEGLDVVGGLSFDLATNSRDNAATDKLYVGFASADWGTVTFGRQTLLADDDGIGKDYELGYGQYMADQVETADEVVKYVFDNGQYYAGISHDVKAEGDDYDNDSNISVLDGRIGARFAGVDARLYVYTDENTNNTDADLYGADEYETTAFNLEVEYAVNEAVAVAASYGEADVDSLTAATNKNLSDTKYIEVNGSYTMDKTTYALGYVYSDEDVTDTETKNIYVNVTQQLHDNVKLYAEVGYADEDSENVNNADIDFAYLVGMEVNF